MQSEQSGSGGMGGGPPPSTTRQTEAAMAQQWQQGLQWLATQLGMQMAANPTYFSQAYPANVGPNPSIHEQPSPLEINYQKLQLDIEHTLIKEQLQFLQQQSIQQQNFLRMQKLMYQQKEFVKLEAQDLSMKATVQRLGKVEEELAKKLRKWLLHTQYGYDCPDSKRSGRTNPSSISNPTDGADESMPTSTDENSMPNLLADDVQGDISQQAGGGGQLGPSSNHAGESMAMEENQFVGGWHATISQQLGGSSGGHESDVVENEYERSCVAVFRIDQHPKSAQFAVTFRHGPHVVLNMETPVKLYDSENQFVCDGQVLHISEDTLPIPGAPNDGRQGYDFVLMSVQLPEGWVPPIYTQFSPEWFSRYILLGYPEADLRSLDGDFLNKRLPNARAGRIESSEYDVQRCIFGTGGSMDGYSGSPAYTVEENEKEPRLIGICLGGPRKIPIPRLMNSAAIADTMEKVHKEGCFAPLCKILPIHIVVSMCMAIIGPIADKRHMQVRQEEEERNAAMRHSKAKRPRRNPPTAGGGNAGASTAPSTSTQQRASVMSLGSNSSWVEKNATPWSLRLLTQLLIGSKVEADGATIDYIKFTEFKKLRGEATAIRRKARLIFIYEWEIELKFAACMKTTGIGSNDPEEEREEYTGSVEISNLRDECSLEEITLSVNLDSASPHDAELRSLLATNGLDHIRHQWATYSRKLKEEFSHHLTIAPPQPGKAKEEASANPEATPKPVAMRGEEQSGQLATSISPVSHPITPPSAADGTAKSEGVRAKPPASTAHLKLIGTFKVAPDHLYEILTSPGLVEAWAGGEAGATIDAHAGGEFNFLDSSINGRFVKLVENKEIVAHFRLKSYPDGWYANMQLSLADQADSTDLVIEVDGLPEGRVEETIQGLTGCYFKNIGCAFGCGMKML